MDVIELMETCTAMRYLKEDPVAKADLERLVYAATRASSPGNSQGWEFVIIDDAGKKAQIAAAVQKNMAPIFATIPEGLDAVQERMYRGAKHLAENFARVPAWILGASRKIYPPDAPEDVFMYSTIFPAAQNMIVAARSMNIGTCFTTFNHLAEAEIRQACNVPEDVHLCVMVAVGYPQRKFMPVKRRPVSEVLHWNSF